MLSCRVDLSEDRWELLGHRSRQTYCFIHFYGVESLHRKVRSNSMLLQVGCDRRVHRLRVREFLLVLLLLPSATLAHGVYERPAFDNSLAAKLPFISLAP
jgi:hypothetical protein